MATSKPLEGRSGLERSLFAQLDDAKVAFQYEALAVPYIPKPKKYYPDILLPNGIVIEAKGWFVTQDRTKVRLVVEQHPDLDLRFVFSNSKTRISKTSSTTYGEWATRLGIKYADRWIPAGWLKEPVDPVRLKAALAFLRG